MTHGYIGSNGFSLAKRVEKLSLEIAENRGIHAKVLGVLFDHIADCEDKIKDSPEDKNLSIELDKLEGYVDTINILHDSTNAVLGELKRFWVALSKGEDFPEWDD